MSQLMDALEKAERERSKSRELKKTTVNYGDVLQQPKKQPKRIKLLLLPLLAVILTLAGVMYFKTKGSSSNPAKQQIMVDKQPTKAEKETKDEAISKENERGNPDPKDLALTAKTRNNEGKTTPKDNSDQLAALKPEQATKDNSNQLATLEPEQPEKDSADQLATLTPDHSKIVELKTPSPKEHAKTSKRKTEVAKNSPHKERPTKGTNKEPAWKKGLTINALVYDENPTRSFALIAGKKVVIGNIIPDTKFKVISILKGGVVVDDGNGEVFISSF